MRYLCLDTGRSKFDDFSEWTVTTLLRDYGKHGRLEELHLTVAAPSTNDYLSKVLDCLPTLRKIVFVGLGISAKAVLQVIVEGKLKNAVIRHEERAWIRARLREGGLNHLQRNIV